MQNKNDLIFNSFDVENSTYVHTSKNVRDSRHVFHSEDVGDSVDVSSSLLIEKSRSIHGSKYVYDSEQVAQSSNINLSKNIVLSNMIIASQDVFRSTDCDSCGQIRDGERLRQVYFSSECKDLRNALFCYNTSGAECMIFNTPVSKEKFEMALNQYKKLVSPLVFITPKEWPKENLVAPKILVRHNYQSHYELCSQKLFDWAKTLPGYDPMILYNITMLPQIIAN